ncbi:MAG: hypothetical protein QNJ77_10150 [Acidimicrobiia bacterium]|nr:hypothetical protein [Acidimicrobiia bacterium]
MAVRREWELDYDVDDVLRSQAADPAAIRARRPRLVDMAQRALDAGRGMVQPAVLTRTLQVAKSRHNRITLEGGATLTGPLITEHLGGAEDITVMLCTIGDELGKAAVKESETNLSYAYALDAVGSAAVHSLNAAACNQVEQNAIAAGLQTSLPLSPGMEGWEVDPGQREIFSIIDGDEVGVALSPTLEMRPLKSLTAIVGIGKQVATKGAICDYCALRDTCRQKIA